MWASTTLLQEKGLEEKERKKKTLRSVKQAAVWRERERESDLVDSSSGSFWFILKVKMVILISFRGVVGLT
jgi:hypothetical protein